VGVIKTPYFNMNALWEFIQKCIDEQGIDESHGLTHAKNCVEWVKLLYKEEHDVSEDEINLVPVSRCLGYPAWREFFSIFLPLHRRLLS
jgi:hypothetical protein